MPFPSINAGGLECLSWLGLSYALWRDTKKRGGGGTSRMEKLKNRGVTKGKTGLLWSRGATVIFPKARKAVRGKK